jgi:NADPH-dependent 2,4-dienoyl-CoA reductase/sulfur reductase-like enzyme
VTLLDLTPRVATSDRLSTLPVVVIGAGPIGLAAAAHLIDRDIDVIVLESGDSVGASVRSWGHTRLFSPWKHLVDPVARRMLEASGWELRDPERAPTGAELVEFYLEPLAALDPMASVIRTGTRVVAVTREGMDRTRSRARAATPFVLRVTTDDGIEELSARAVIDASGTYSTPNPLSSNGLGLLGFDEIAEAVMPALPDVHGRDRARSLSGEHPAGSCRARAPGAGHLRDLVDPQRPGRAGVLLS